jgi:hypothetical protein
VTAGLTFEASPTTEGIPAVPALAAITASALRTSPCLTPQQDLAHDLSGSVGGRSARDALNRASQIKGTLALNLAQKRNAVAQRTAGGLNRLLTDEGGHFIGRRFNGPMDQFNHFAQDMNLNREVYKALENQWHSALKRGSAVEVEITPKYADKSLRPHTVDMKYTIDGIEHNKSFINRPGG